MNKLNSKSSLKKVAAATKLADQALKHYGAPTMTLSELRATLSQQQKGLSLSDLVLQDREAGW